MRIILIYITFPSNPPRPIAPPLRSSITFPCAPPPIIQNVNLGTEDATTAGDRITTWCIAICCCWISFGARIHTIFRIAWASIDYVIAKWLFSAGLFGMAKIRSIAGGSSGAIISPMIFVEINWRASIAIRGIITISKVNADFLYRHLVFVGPGKEFNTGGQFAGTGNNSAGVFVVDGKAGDIFSYLLHWRTFIVNAREFDGGDMRWGWSFASDRVAGFGDVPGGKSVLFKWYANF